MAEPARRNNESDEAQRPGTKSGVRRNFAMEQNVPRGTFKEGDDVEKMVKENDEEGRMEFKIVQSKNENGDWLYQLKRADGSLHKEGDKEWFEQDLLEFA